VLVDKFWVCGDSRIVNCIHGNSNDIVNNESDSVKSTPSQFIHNPYADNDEPPLVHSQVQCKVEGDDVNEEYFDVDIFSRCDSNQSSLRYVDLLKHFELQNNSNESIELCAEALLWECIVAVSSYTSGLKSELPSADIGYRNDDSSRTLGYEFQLKLFESNIGRFLLLLYICIYMNLYGIVVLIV
jgi:hypothetical protein